MPECDWVLERPVPAITDCHFYHTMDVPGHGLVHGEWDLRGREEEYLGGVDVSGKRVLELGTASGHICFWMERMGAAVSALDLSGDQEWDMVPYHGLDLGRRIADRQSHIERLNNGFWFAHAAFGSKARVHYGSVYDMPEDAGQFDIATMGSILLHLRDPFLALQRLSGHVGETIIVTDMRPGLKCRVFDRIGGFLGIRPLYFLPDAGRCEPIDTWWRLSPGLIAEFLGIAGFPDVRITRHRQKLQDREIEMFTVVGSRR
ncbi:MAG: class I SAM-dependent methyltransferase [Candidatus Fermentibacter sp.]|nr:class I SAM-dependent methyltransferase [Candidatus Fermentibacter sp.]